MITGFIFFSATTKFVNFLTNVILKNPSASFNALEIEREHSTNVNLSIYNHLGQRVAVLADGKQAAGSQVFSGEILPK